jgi:RNA-directed DNA polymerase
MASLSRFLWVKLKLRLNEAKSAVDRPWRRKFLGYSMTWHRRPRLKVAPANLTRFQEKVREWLRGGRGRNLGRQIKELSPLLRGWVNYFRLAEVKGVFETLDGWLRRKLRCILWRQWKRPYTLAKNLMKNGLGEERAWESATNGRGPWWNSGASHMNEAFPKRFFDDLGLVSLLDYLRMIHVTSGTAVYGTVRTVV